MALSVAERNASDPFQACPWVSNEVSNDTTKLVRDALLIAYD